MGIPTLTEAQTGICGMMEWWNGGGIVSNKTLVKVVLAGAVLVAIGVGVYAVINRLPDEDFRLILGGVGVLAVVASVGVLFIAKDLVQAYVMRRLLAQDDYNDLKQMAMVAKLMGGNRAPNVNVKMPPGQPQMLWPMLSPQAQGQADFDGTYRDTVVYDNVELE